VGGGGGGGNNNNNNSSGGGKKGGDNGGANDGGMSMKVNNEERSSIPSAVMIDKTTNQDNPNLSTITLATDEESSCGTVDKGILLLDVSSLTAERSCPTTPTDIKEWFATRNNTVALSSSLFEDVDASVEVESVVKSCSNSVEIASVVKSSNDNAVTRDNLLEDSNVPPLPVQDLVAKEEEEEENNVNEATTNNYSIHSPARVLLSTTMMSGQQQIEKRLLAPSIVLANRLSRKASNRSQQSHDASSTTVVRRSAPDEDEAHTLDNSYIETSSPPSSNLNSNQLGNRDMTDATITTPLHDKLKRAQLHSHTRSNISNASSSADAGSGSERNSICMNDNNPTNPTPRSRTKKKSTISDYFCIPTVSSSDIHQVVTTNNNETIVVGGTTCSSESPTGISDFPLTGNNNSMAEKKKKNVDDATCNSDDTEKTTNATGMKIVDSNGEDVGGNKSSSSNSKLSRNNYNPTVLPPPDGGGCTDIFDDIAKFFTCQFGNTKDILEVVAEEGDYKSLELEENQCKEEEGDAKNISNNNNTSTILDETNSKAEGIIQPRELFDAKWFESPSQLKDDFLINNNKEDDDRGEMNDSSSVGEASVELCLLGVDDRDLLKSKNSWDTTTSKQSSRSTSQSYSSMSSMARNLLKTVGGKRSSSKDTESNTSKKYMSPPEIQRNHHQSDDIFNTQSQSQDEISYGSLTTFDDDTMDNSCENQVDEFPCDETASAATTISKEETILSKETDAMSFRSEESNPTWFDKCVEGGCTFAPAEDQNYEDYSYTSAELALRTHYIESQDCIVARDNSLYPAISANSTNTASLHDRSRANRYQKRMSKGGTNWRHDGGLDSCLTDGTDRTGLTDETDRTGLTDETDRTGLTDETDRTDNDLLASCLTDGTRTDNDMSTVGSSRSSDFTPLESRNEELYKYDTSSVHSESIMSESPNRDTTHGQQDTIKTPRIGSGIKRTGSRIRTLAQSILPYGRSSDSVSEVDSIR
jgi:hypothetical protein